MIYKIYHNKLIIIYVNKVNKLKIVLIKLNKLEIMYQEMLIKLLIE